MNNLHEVCYKVVRVCYDADNVERYFSYNHSIILEYFLGGLTEPKIGKIFVFRNIRDASLFYWGGRKPGLLKVFECLADDCISQNTAS